MRLSEAIRLGAMLKPQHFGTMFAYADDDLDQSAAIASCALGAATDAGYPDVFESQLAEGYTELTCAVRTCGFRHCLANQISHLNDEHRWTREAIADWVESQEAPRVPLSLDASDPHAEVPGNLATRV